MASGDKIHIGIKSIQRGTIVIKNGSSSASVTISPVDVNKTILNNTGFMTSVAGSGGYAALWNGYIQLENETTIVGKRYGYENNDLTIGYEVIEFY